MGDCHRDWFWVAVEREAVIRSLAEEGETYQEAIGRGLLRLVVSRSTLCKLRSLWFRTEPKNHLNPASVLEGLSVLASGSRDKFVLSTPSHLRTARTCYDHMAGTLGVLLHDRLQALGWLSLCSTDGKNAYDLTQNGTRAFEALGVDVEETRMLRRRFACACLDWSERRPHVGDALGAALLKVALKQKWVIQELDSRALTVTKVGRREMLTRFAFTSEAIFASNTRGIIFGLSDSKPGYHVVQQFVGPMHSATLSSLNFFPVRL